MENVAMRDASDAGATGTEDRPECRALAVVVPSPPRPAARPLVGFVAQLIACQDRLGEFRRARRIDASTGAVRYAGAVEMRPAASGFVCIA